MHSAIYEGRVRHRRYEPVGHEFSYRICLLYLDLSELEDLFRRRWLWSVNRFNLASFFRRDYFGDPEMSLETAIRDLVERRTGNRPVGPIRLLTCLRYFGYIFNPVSFYFCFDRTGGQVESVAAEITNTPWGERHTYVLSGPGESRESRTMDHSFEKTFHISPFMEMDMNYRWLLGSPGRRLHIHMENHSADRKVFDATMALDRRPANGRNLARVLFRYPFMTAQVRLAIYWQALRLRLKGCPFHEHPKRREATLNEK